LKSFFVSTGLFTATLVGYGFLRNSAQKITKIDNAIGRQLLSDLGWWSKCHNFHALIKNFEPN